MSRGAANFGQRLSCTRTDAGLYSLGHPPSDMWTHSYICIYKDTLMTYTQRPACTNRSMPVHPPVSVRSTHRWTHVCSCLCTCKPGLGSAWFPPSLLWAQEACERNFPLRLATGCLSQIPENLPAISLQREASFSASIPSSLPARYPQWALHHLLASQAFSAPGTVAPWLCHGP